MTMMNNEDKLMLCGLILELVDGVISSERMETLDEWLRRSPEALDVYRDVIKDTVVLKRHISVLLNHEEALLNGTLWQALAEEEKAAPTIEICREEPQGELIQKVVYPPREKRRISRFSILMLINAAAILLFFLFLRIAPAKFGAEVATLTDSINAKWAAASSPIEKGTRLTTHDDSLFLQDGLAELVFDNDTKVVIEGPAEFALLADDRIDLRYGRIYVAVSPEAIGFTISTPTSRIIDLGTEFGVQADLHGELSLHMIKGKTTLIAGTRSNRVNLEVNQGQAKKVSSQTLTVTDIACQTELFVRDIDSSAGVAWRGQLEIDLADIVGGGNGFGTGQLGKGISLSDGAMESDYRGVGLRGTGDYILVTQSKYVDGVFVPDSSNKPLQVSSQGHIFKGCPATSKYYTMLVNGGISKTLDSTRYPLELDGQVYGTTENPALQMRANSGITFDLNAIRDAVPGRQIRAFRSKAGISSNAERSARIERGETELNNVNVSADSQEKSVRADVFVLIDGQLKQTASLTCDPKTIVNIDISLTSEDRFLTLVSAQGDNEWDHDWVMFAKPVIVLEQVE